MAELYGKVFEEENILTAIKEVLKNKGSKTAGPDGISRKNIMNEKGEIINVKGIIKEVKMRLRRCKKVNSRTVEIPKSNGKTRTLTIINLYDRIAQQAVYQIVGPIVEAKFSKHSYGFRMGLSTKIPVSKIVAGMSNAKHVYTIEIDFSKCFDNIPLESAIGMAKELGISNSKLLKTIKHLMYYSKDYKGIELGQGTILGPMLANCFLHKMDRWVEANVDTGNRKSHDVSGFKRNRNNFAEWLKSRGRTSHGKYYRYADDTILICATRSEQVDIYNRLREFIDKELKIPVNEEKTRLGYNCFDFLGYHIKKKRDEVSGKWCINITPSDIKGLRKEIKSLTFRSGQACVDSMKKIIGILNYYDICNNMTWVIKHINDRMYRHTLRSGSNIKCVWNKEERERRYTYIYKGRLYNVSPWEIRRKTKQSCKDYIIHSAWLSLKEQVNDVETEWYRPYYLERTTLWTKQKGKDYCTGILMNPKRMHIHHMDGNQRNNKWKNLILVSPETHRMIHSNEETDNKRILKCRKALKS